MTNHARTDRSSDIPARGTVRRKCACGGGQQGNCEECKRKAALQRKSGNADQPSAVPPVVNEVLRSSGQPLENRTRQEMEQRFGYSFEHVRVHAGPRAAESAHAINALAYTAGSHVVFGEGRYAPGSPSGDRLLAHELTHVVQQNSAPFSGPLTLDSSEPDAAEREAERAETAPLLVNSRPAGIRRKPDEQAAPMGSPPTVTFDLPPPRALEARRLAEEDPFGLGPLAEPVPTEAESESVPTCDPDRALTRADFQGTPPSSTFGALTDSKVVKKSVGGATLYQATLDKSASWVKPLFGRPTDRSVNNCADPVKGCQDFFDSLKPGESGSQDFDVPPDPNCPASVTLATVTAKSRDECESVIGASCDATRVQESNRLLAHEQGHFDITCVFAHKANDALAAGKSESAIDGTLTTKLNAIQRKYDTKTNHGCIVAQQSSWETDIAAGLPNITIP